MGEGRVGMTIFDAFPFVLWEEALVSCEPLLLDGVFRDTRTMGNGGICPGLWGLADLEERTEPDMDGRMFLIP